jgi:hypothetical protein
MGFFVGFLEMGFEGGAGFGWFNRVFWVERGGFGLTAKLFRLRRVT